MCAHGLVLIPGPHLLSHRPACLLEPPACRAPTQELHSIALTQELHSTEAFLSVELGSLLVMRLDFRISHSIPSLFIQWTAQQEVGSSGNPTCLRSTQSNSEEKGSFSPLIWITFQEAWQVKTDMRLVQHVAEKTQSSPAQAFLLSLSSSSLTSDGCLTLKPIGHTLCKLLKSLSTPKPRREKINSMWTRQYANSFITESLWLKTLHNCSQS